ncbi:MAG TPA: MFS transporter [Thermomicrobiales bacterium]|nr:MFS transporter [Thermomicrobiales bacterium]
MSTKRTGFSLLVLVTFLAFVSIGFPDAVLGVAWPSIRATFDRALSDVGFILVSSGSGYFLSGVLAGAAIERLGIGRLLVLSTTAVAVGLFSYAATPNFWLLLGAAVLIGFGSGAIDTGLNVYASEHFSVTVMNWLHAFFGIGAMLGPFIMASVLAAGGSWRIGYIIVASAIAAMAAVFVVTARQWDGDAHHVDAEPAARISARLVVRMPLVWVQVVLFFVMPGLEASAGLWTATMMLGRFDASAGEAGLWAGIFWGAMALGRLVLAPLSGDLNPARLVQLGTIGVLLGSILMIPDQQWVFQAGLIVFGLAMAPLFPTLMSLTPRRFGSQVAMHAIGFQVSAATAGIIGVPVIAGYLAERTTLSTIPWVMSIGAVVVIALETLLRTRADRQSPATATPTPA